MILRQRWIVQILNLAWSGSRDRCRVQFYWVIVMKCILLYMYLHHSAVTVAVAVKLALSARVLYAIDSIATCLSKDLSWLLWHKLLSINQLCLTYQTPAMRQSLITAWLVNTRFHLQNVAVHRPGVLYRVHRICFTFTNFGCLRDLFWVDVFSLCNGRRNQLQSSVISDGIIFVI